VKTFRLDRSTLIHRTIDEVFPYFADAGNLERITPPWLRFRILTPRPIEMAEGTLIDYSLGLHGVPIRWKTRIAAWEPPRLFIDEQVKGPYSLWRHTHSFEADPAGSEGTLMRDIVAPSPPAGPLSPLINRLYVRRELDRIFDYRAKAIEEAFHAPHARA